MRREKAMAGEVKKGCGLGFGLVIGILAACVVIPVMCIGGTCLTGAGITAAKIAGEIEAQKQADTDAAAVEVDTGPDTDAGTRTDADSDAAALTPAAPAVTITTPAPEEEVSAAPATIADIIAAPVAVHARIIAQEYIVAEELAASEATPAPAAIPAPAKPRPAPVTPAKTAVRPAIRPTPPTREPSPGEIQRRYERALKRTISVSLRKKTSVQTAVQTICGQVGVPYQWRKSADLCGTRQRLYVGPFIRRTRARDAITELTRRAKLKPAVNEDGVYIRPK